MTSRQLDTNRGKPRHIETHRNTLRDEISIAHSDVSAPTRVALSSSQRTPLRTLSSRTAIVGGPPTVLYDGHVGPDRHSELQRPGDLAATQDSQGDSTHAGFRTVGPQSSDAGSLLEPPNKHTRPCRSACPMPFLLRDSAVAERYVEGKLERQTSYNNMVAVLSQLSDLMGKEVLEKTRLSENVLIWAFCSGARWLLRMRRTGGGHPRRRDHRPIGILHRIVAGRRGTRTRGRPLATTCLREETSGVGWMVVDEPHRSCGAVIG